MPKVLNEFRKNATRRIGVQSMCRPCEDSDKKKYYATNLQEYKARSTARRNRIKQENVEFLLEYFETHPCVDCGEADPVVLDFDHVRGKKSDHIGGLMAKNKRVADLKAEIEKCDVRCANCHRRKTAKQFNWRRLRFGQVAETV